MPSFRPDRFYSDFDEYEFERHVEESLASVRRVLDTERSATIGLAETIDHRYADKYKLADGLTNTAIVALLAVLEHLGLTREKLVGIADAAAASKKATTLRFAVVSLSSTFVKEEVVDRPLVSKTTETTTTEQSSSKDFGKDDVTNTTKSSTIETIVDRVVQKHYDCDAAWELSVVSGTDVEDRTILGERKCHARVIRERSSSSSEKEEESSVCHEDRPTIELPLTWLLQQIDATEGKSHFAIDTTTAATKTPIRNLQVEQALEFFDAASKWSAKVWDEIGTLVFHFQNGTRIDALDELRKTSRLGEREIFIPTLPVLASKKKSREIESSETDEAWIQPEAGREESESHPEEGTDIANHPGNDDDDDDDSSMISAADTLSFLNEHARTLSEVQGKLEERFPDPGVTGEIVSSQEAKMSVFFTHLRQLVYQYVNSIQYIEIMLEKQLVAAIGKKVTSSDLDKYIRYHNEKLLNPSPKPFCYTIRRPEHYPDGILSIEEVQRDSYDSKKTIESIATHVREISSVDPIEVPLNAATTIELTGKTYVHGWLKQRFGRNRNDDGRTYSGRIESIRLNARARQFSSFVLLVGTMEKRNRFQPKDAIILRNKDEVHIPLLLNEIPTATEFKKSICSLSPEQQRFAQSFRSMQLESSILGVCVVQIKPQLERLLGLPRDALTKEMKLTEDLTELFVEYQVPSDLVSCDRHHPEGENNNNNNNSVKDQVASVRAHVQSVLDVITAQKEEQLGEQVQKAEMEKARQKSQQRHRRRWAEENDGEESMPPKYYENANRGICGGLVAPFSSVAKPQASFSVGAARLSAVPKGKQSKSLGYNSYGAELTDNENYVDGVTKSTPPNEDGSEKNTGSNKLGPDSKDFMAIPKILDKAIELHDRNAAIRSTTIETNNNNWTRISQKNLLSKSVEERLSEDAVATETSRAFDLLDAMSRSGSLSIPASELHVVICATHRFEKSVMETVLLDNVNPIEKLELSTLLMASTILNTPVHDLVGGSSLERLETSFPRLLGGGGNVGNNDATGQYNDETNSDRPPSFNTNTIDDLGDY